MSAKIKAAAGVAATAALLYAIQHSTPLYGEITSPIVVTGTQGEKIEAANFAFDVRRVRLARELATESFDRTKVFSSSGLWVVVEAEAEALSESTSLMSANWISGEGISYALSDRLPPSAGLMPAEVLEPGLPRPVLLAFEVPERALDDGAVAVARTKLLPLDDEIRITVSEPSTPDVEPRITVRRQDGEPAWTLSPKV